MDKIKNWKELSRRRTRERAEAGPLLREGPERLSKEERTLVFLTCIVLFGGVLFCGMVIYVLFELQAHWLFH